MFGSKGEHLGTIRAQVVGTAGGPTARSVNAYPLIFITGGPGPPTSWPGCIRRVPIASPILGSVRLSRLRHLR